MKRLLIVVDMQNDFVTGVLGTREAQMILPAVNAKIAAAEQVIFTLDTHDETYLSTQEGRLLPVPHCLRGTWGHALAEGMCLPEESERIEKPTFGSVTLGQRVRELYGEGKISSAELIGVCTDICLISNALLLKAACPELPISVDASCCAGVTPERHQTALDAMAACQITVTNRSR